MDIVRIITSAPLLSSRALGCLLNGLDRVLPAFQRCSKA